MPIYLIFILIVSACLLIIYAFTRVYFLVFYNYSKEQFRHKPRLNLKTQKILLSDGYQLAYRFTTASQSKYLFICFHGLNGDMNDFRWFFKFAQNHRFSCVIFDQRNFGKNPRNSSFDLKQNLNDLITVIKLFKKHFPSQKMILVGHSLGTALLTHLMRLPAINRIVYAYVLTGIVISRKVYNPFVFLDFNLRNLISLVIGLLFYSQKVISLRNFNRNVALGIPIKSQKAFYTHLDRLRLPLYFFTQAAYYNYRLIHNFKFLRRQTPVLVMKQTRDVLVDKKAFTRFFQTQRQRLPKLKIGVAEGVEHALNSNYAVELRLQKIIKQWLAELEPKTLAPNITPHKSQDNQEKK